MPDVNKSQALAYSLNTKTEKVVKNGRVRRVDFIAFIYSISNHPTTQLF